MTTFHVLGVFWFALWCYRSFNFCKRLPTRHPGQPAFLLIWSVWIATGLLAFFGVAAGTYLFLGATWARWPISLLCAFEIASHYSFSHLKVRSPDPIIDSIALALALISLVLLFWPGHETFGLR